MACAVSTTSEEVRPKCSQRADGPACSAPEVVKAMTSCCVIFSISSMRATSNAAFSRSVRAASFGTMPASAIASAAANSTCSHVSYFRCSLQIRPISGWVYREIIYGIRPPILECQLFTRDPESVDVAQHGDGQGIAGEDPMGEASDILLADPLVRREHLIERVGLVAVHLLPRQMRHAARRAFEAEHQR